MLRKVNKHLKGKKAGLGKKSSGDLPCIVFADFVFSSVLSDKFCFCVKTCLFNISSLCHIQKIYRFKISFQIFKVKCTIVKRFVL